MKSLNVAEAREVCKNQEKWRSILSVLPLRETGVKVFMCKYCFQIALLSLLVAASQAGLIAIDSGHDQAVSSQSIVRHDQSTTHHEPIYQQTAQVYHQAAPVYQQSAPIYQQSAPIYHQSAQVYHQQAPVYHQTAPIIQHHHVAPVVEHQAPITHYSAPIATKVITPVAYAQDHIEEHVSG